MDGIRLVARIGGPGTGGALLIGLTAVLGIAACSNPANQAGSVPTRSQKDVRAEVQAQADQIAKLVGAPLENPKVNPAFCVYRTGTGDHSVIVMQGTYDIALPAGRQAGAGVRVRDAWKAAGWTITEDATQDKTMELAGTTPAKFTVRLGSTTPPNALIVLVQSPCFRDRDAS